VLNNKLE